MLGKLPDKSSAWLLRNKNKNMFHLVNLNTQTRFAMQELFLFKCLGFFTKSLSVKAERNTGKDKKLHLPFHLLHLSTSHWHSSWYKF